MGEGELERGLPVGGYKFSRCSSSTGIKPYLIRDLLHAPLYFSSGIITSRLLQPSAVLV